MRRAGHGSCRGKAFAWLYCRGIYIREYVYLDVYLACCMYMYLYLSTGLPIYLSIYPSTYLPTFLSTYLSTYLAMYLYIRAQLSTAGGAMLGTCVALATGRAEARLLLGFTAGGFIYVSKQDICMYIYVCVYTSIVLYMCIDIHLSTRLPTCLFIYLSIYLPTYLSIYTSMHPSIYVYTNIYARSSRLPSELCLVPALR